MSGWAKALLIIAVATIGLIALNVAMWRRMRAATRRHADASGRDKEQI